MRIKSFTEFKSNLIDIKESNLVNESFINLLPNDYEKKEKWVDRVWDMLQGAY